MEPTHAGHSTVEFIGPDLKIQASPDASQCRSLCKANSPCTHFTWIYLNVSSLPFHSILLRFPSFASYNASNNVSTNYL
jgi:hypothetical protein